MDYFAPTGLLWYPSTDKVTLKNIDKQIMHTILQLFVQPNRNKQ